MSDLDTDRAILIRQIREVNRKLENMYELVNRKRDLERQLSALNEEYVQAK
jgi:hypothetical protein